MEAFAGWYMTPAQLERLKAKQKERAEQVARIRTDVPTVAVSALQSCNTFN